MINLLSTTQVIDDRMAGGFDEHPFDTGKMVLNYVQGPMAGPPIVLLHGLSEHWQVFEATFPLLSLKWHVHALDLRGHGKSDWATGHYKAKEYAEDVMTFLRGKFDEPAVLVGYCLGGIVCYEVAALAPERVRGIIVGDMPTTWERIEEKNTGPVDTCIHSACKKLAQSRGSVDEIARSLAMVRVPVPEHHTTVRFDEIPGMDMAYFRSKASGLMQIDPDTLTLHAEGRVREFLEGYEADFLKQISCPALLLQADPARGGFMTDRDVRTALSLIPKASHIRFKNIAPWFGFERGEVEPAVLQAMINFLEAL